MMAVGVIIIKQGILTCVSRPVLAVAATVGSNMAPLASEIAY